MKNNFLIVDKLTKRFGEKTISISFELKEKEAISLLGPSGCGKSTVLGMIAGLVKADSGKVILDAKDITELKPFERNLGMVFQNYALFPHLNVFQNIAFGLYAKKLRREEKSELVNFWLEKFSIKNLAKRSVQNLSGGEKQRVALARTLICSPKLILFDEPLSALDSDLRKELQVELRESQKREGYAAVYVSHDADEADFLSDKTFRF